MKPKPILTFASIVMVLFISCGSDRYRAYDYIRTTVYEGKPIPNGTAGYYIFCNNPGSDYPNRQGLIDSVGAYDYKIATIDTSAFFVYRGAGYDPAILYKTTVLYRADN